MPWSKLLSQPPPELKLRFRSGHKRLPEGETLLTVSGAGVARLERWGGGARTVVERGLSLDEVQALFAALAATGFPEVVLQTVPPGPGMIAVEVEGGPEQLPVLMHRSVVRESPAWSALVDRLDALCARLA